MLFLYLRINRITLRNIGRNTKHVSILIIFLNFLYLCLAESKFILKMFYEDKMQR